MAAETSEASDDRPASEVRTAVVIVHAMGRKRPLEKLDGFLQTALHPLSAFYPTSKKWEYHHPRSAELTGTYETDRYVSPQLDGESTEPHQGHAEIFEYHWAFHLTGSRFGGLVPTTLLLFLRRPSNVPDALFGIWRVVWTVLLAPIFVGVPALIAVGYFLSTGVPGWIIGLVTSAIVLFVGLGLARFVSRALANNVVTAPLVEVARYLDWLPYSYAGRRAVREGLVDLLHTLQDGRYSRIVVVAHSVGAFIAYDALSALWTKTHELHAGPPPDGLTPLPIALGSLDGLQGAADRLLADSAGDGALDDFQDRQFALWQDLRWQGNPWRITDFVTVGAPMALADLLLTRPGMVSGLTASDRKRRRDLFDGLVRHGALVLCPPRTETQPVEGDQQGGASYGWDENGVRELLGSQSPFAVTRWTNLWFPVTRGSLRGDWFGGALRPLFGPGIRDIDVRGNTPERLKHGSAHIEYFRHPEKDDEGDMARHLRTTLALQTHAVLESLLTAPSPEPSPIERRVPHSGRGG
jgi:hypothetical protein